MDNESELKILTVVDKINKDQKLIIVKKLLAYFSDDIKNKHFAVWGLSFKPNTDDIREAPSLVIINELLKSGASITAYDPAAMETAKYYLKDKIKYAADEYKALDNADALLILTEWNEFRNPDFEILKSKLKNRVIFDGRNIFDPERMRELDFTYFSIGRIPVYSS